MEHQTDRCTRLLDLVTWLPSEDLSPLSLHHKNSLNILAKQRLVALECTLAMSSHLPKIVLGTQAPDVQPQRRSRRNLGHYANPPTGKWQTKRVSLKFYCMTEVPDNL